MANLQDYAFQQARLRNLDPAFVARLIRAESGGNPTAVSPVGARGLMQIMPATGRELGLQTPADFFDPQKSITAGTTYLERLSKQPGGSNPSLLAAMYNAGPGRVGRLIAQYGINPAAILPRLPRETQTYVAKVAGPASGFVSAAPVGTSRLAGVPAFFPRPLFAPAPMLTSFGTSSPFAFAAPPPAPAFTLDDTALLDIPRFREIAL